MLIKWHTCVYKFKKKLKKKNYKTQIQKFDMKPQLNTLSKHLDLFKLKRELRNTSVTKFFLSQSEIYA